MLFTVDSCVFIAAVLDTEPAHQASKEFLIRLKTREQPCVIPATVLVETACALARRSTVNDIGMRVYSRLSEDPTITVMPLSASDAVTITELGTRCRLRGMDAIVAACAKKAGATLVTLDEELIEKLDGVLTIKRPSETG
ncbi:MAG: PIN domain-containing protein [Candidatus Hydrogenedentota bacterium]|nr:MAG: PIN domain-containing protein [Candidatus Hydrogenedentota bacterium]